MRILALVIASAFAVLDERQAVEDLPTCRFGQVAERSSWQTVSEGPVELLVPETYEVDEEARFIHGGRAWGDGTSTARIVWGHWDRASFWGREATFCKLPCGEGVSVVAELELDDRIDFALFEEPTEVSIESPMVSASGPAADRHIALGIVLSACRPVSPGP